MRLMAPEARSYLSKDGCSPLEAKEKRPGAFLGLPVSSQLQLLVLLDLCPLRGLGWGEAVA